ncbi:MAG: FtsX-like permease family protein, partial [Clostridium perfringens]|nr:FtsX-like permease family protein [Clostridium perfringens]
DINKLKEIPIGDIADKLGIDTVKRGNKLWCNLRGEKTASCCINIDKNYFYDFGGQPEGGDGIKFVSKAEGISAKDSIYRLADMFGIEPENNIDNSFKPSFHISNSDYKEIGIEPNRAMLNVDINLERQSLAEVMELEKSCAKTMNELANDDKSAFLNILNFKSMPIVYNNAKTYYSCIERINEYVKEYNSPIDGFNSLEVLLYKDFTKNLEEKLNKQIDILYRAGINERIGFDLSEEKVAVTDWIYAKNNLKISVLDIEVMAISTYSIILPTIILLITVVLISIVLGRMIKNDMAGIGTLYALGYRKKEIMMHYLNYPIILSLTGGVVGGVIGIIAQKYIFDLFLEFFPIPVEKLSYSPMYFILGIVLCVLFTVVGSYISINKILKASPVSLMKNEFKTKKVNIIERKINLKGFKFKTKFAIREQLRSIPRLAFLVIGVSIATIFLMYGFIAKCSMDYAINQDNNNIFSYNYEYILKQPTTDKAPKGSEEISGIRFAIDTTLKDKFELMGVSKNSDMVSLKNKDGSKISIDDDKFIITSKMAKEYKLDVGDKLSFINMMDDKKYSVTITDIAKSNTGDYVFTSLDNFNKMMGLKKGEHSAIISKSPIKIDKDLLYMTNTPSNMKDMLADYMDLMETFIYAIAVVAFIIGIIIVYIIASISIDENKNNIALMKVFGYKKKEINSMMLNGSRIYVVIGYIIGVPI